MPQKKVATNAQRQPGFHYHQQPIVYQRQYTRYHARPINYVSRNHNASYHAYYPRNTNDHAYYEDNRYYARNNMNHASRNPYASQSEYPMPRFRYANTNMVYDVLTLGPSKKKGIIHYY